MAQFGLAGAGLYVLAQVSGARVDPLAAAAFAAAYVLLGAFGVWLPRGDLADMTGAVVFACGLLVSPIAAAGAVLLGRLTLVLMKRGKDDGWTSLDDVTRQLLVMAWTGVYFWLSTRGVSTLAPVVSEYMNVAIAAALFFAMDLVLAQANASLRLGAPFVGLLVGNLRLQVWVIAAQMSAAVLAVVIYAAMGLFGLVIVVGLLMVMRQSFALLVEVRLAYRSTVEVLARAMEAEDPQKRGHAERVARLATEVGRVLGLQGQRLEDLNYAALFHDVGRLGQDPVLGYEGAGSSADILANVGFLSDAVAILRVLETAGEPVGSESESSLVAAYIVARMSELDDADTVRDALAPPQSGFVGSRLYAETRRGVDRAIKRVEERVLSGRLSLEAPAEELL